MRPAWITHKRVLLTEDDASVRQAIRLLLAIDHHEVTEAQTAEEALHFLQNQNFDLVITDFELPGLKGDDLASHIKQRFPWQPVLMVTAYSEKLAGLDGRVDAILGKPFRFQDLRREIEKLLNPSIRVPCAPPQSIR
jgi:two-component system response regulator FlrC